MKKVVVVFLVICLFVIGGYFLITSKGLLKQQKLVKPSRTIPVKVKQKPEIPSRVKPVEVNRETATPSRYDQYLAIKRKWENDWKKKGFKVLSVTASQDWLDQHKPDIGEVTVLGENPTVVIDRVIITRDLDRNLRVLLPLTVTNPPQNRAPQNELTQGEIAKARKIKTWLKENGYTVTNVSITNSNPNNRDIGTAPRLGATASNGTVTILNMGNYKVKVSVKNVGSAIFIYDNGELQSPNKNP